MRERTQQRIDETPFGLRVTTRGVYNNAVKILVGFLGVFLIASTRVAAVTATNNGNWNVAANWDSASVPAPGDNVIIPAGKTITNTATTASLNSLDVSGTLVFSGWSSIVSATVVSVSGVVSHDVNTDSSSPWVPDHRVYVVCSNLTVSAAGQINAAQKGYRGSLAPANGYGPGGGMVGANGTGSGGGHGGAGGISSADTSVGGPTYGLATAPTNPGSAGGGWSAPANVGGAGGGAIMIEAAGAVVVDGTISADGENATDYAGGGSGGGIYIICNTVQGSGTVAARGGAGGSQAGYTGGGGGGRIAVVCNTAAQAAAGRPAIAFSTRRGAGTYRNGFVGTLYFNSAGIFPYDTLADSYGVLTVVGFTNWAPGNLIVSNSWVEFPGDVQFNVTNNVLVFGSSGGLVLSGGTFRCGGNLTVTNSSQLHVYAAATNSPVPDYGALVQVDGPQFVVAAGCSVYPYAHPTNGATVLFRVQGLTLLAGGQISADTGGYGSAAGANGYGPGRGLYYAAQGVGSGGGYGGAGGSSSGTAGGGTYGSSNAPVEPGSGGAGWSSPATVGGTAGGAVRLQAGGNAVVDGTISADGGNSGITSGQHYGGGGSGGSIYLYCSRTLSGSGLLRARGGNGGTTGSGYSGGGGGGRIAVWRKNAATLSTLVSGGTGTYSNGLSGAVFWGVPKAQGTVIMVQ